MGQMPTAGQLACTEIVWVRFPLCPPRESNCGATPIGDNGKYGFKSRSGNGAIAQMARAPALQAGGRRFESGWLHTVDSKRVLATTASRPKLFIKKGEKPGFESRCRLMARRSQIGQMAE